MIRRIGTFALFLLAAFVPVLVSAATLPNIGIANLVLSQQSFGAGSAVSGTFDLVNNEPTFEGNVGYEIVLSRVSPGGIMDTHLAAGWTALAPHGQAHESFSYTLPANLTAGSYEFSVRAISSTLVELGIGSQTAITVTSDAPGVFVGNAELLVGGKSVASAAVFPSNTPKVSVDITNYQGSQKMTLTPLVVVYKDHAGGTQVAKAMGGQVSIDVHGKKTVTIPLPMMTAPGAYVAEISLLDAASGKPVSNVVDVPWAIIGQSGKILFATPLDPADVTSGQYCTTLPVRVTYASSADGMTDNGPYTVSVTAADARGTSLGTVSGQFAEKASDAVLQVPISSCVSAPRLTATLAIAGTTLDTYTLATGGSGLSLPFSGMNATWLVLLVAILIIIAVTAIMRRTHSMRSFVIMLALGIAASAFFGHSAHAAAATGAACFQDGGGNVQNLPSNGLIAYYPLDTSDFNFSAQTALDRSGNNHTLSLFGSPTSGNVISAVIQQGLMNPNGGGVYGTTAGTLGNPADVTLAAWINETANNGNGVVDAISIGPGDVVLRTDWSGGFSACKYFIGFGNGGTDFDGWNYDRVNQTFVGTGWHQITCVFDMSHSTQTMYIDGVAAGSTNYATPIDYAGTDQSSYFPSTWVEQAPSGTGPGQFFGTLDDVRIYNRALSASEIQQLAGTGPNCTTPNPTATLTASPSTISTGQSSSLTWSSTNATSCTGTGFNTGGATSGSVPVSPSSTTNYSLSCTGASGSANANATVTVSGPPPTATLTANPSSISSGQSSTLNWSSTNASSCTGTGFSTGGATSGSAQVSPNTNTTYSINCSGATANAPVAVTPAPTATISANPTSVPPGGTTTVTWGSTNASSCSGTGFDTGGATSGSTQVPVNGNTTFTVTCTNGATGASATDSTNVTENCAADSGQSCTSAANSCGMTGSGTYQCDGSCSASTPPDSLCPAPQVSVIATPALVDNGSSINVTWSTQNVKNCTITGTDGFKQSNIPDSNGTTVNGSAPDGPITQTVVYTLTCQSDIDGSTITTTSTAHVKPKTSEQ